MNMNDGLIVRYLLGDIEVDRTMNQVELASLLLEEDVFLLSVNAQKVSHIRKKKSKGCSYSNRCK